MSGGSRGYRRTSQPEKWVLDNAEEIEHLERLLNTIKDIELTWLEAGVFLHYFSRGLDLGSTADIIGCHIYEAQAAEESLIRKVAKKLYNGQL